MKPRSETGKMSIKELVVRIKFCQAKVRIFASYVPLGILTMFKDLQQMFESSQICMDQAETEEGMVSLKKYHRLIIMLFFYFRPVDYCLHCQNAANTNHTTLMDFSSNIIAQSHKLF